MILAAAAAFALASAPPLPVVQGTSARAPRYVRVRLDVVAYGIPGTGELVIDRANGRFVRRFSTGASSEQEGYDGTRAWRADATGMPRVQGNVDQRSAIIGASYLFARAPQPQSSVATASPTAVRLRYADLSRSIEVVLQPAKPLVAQTVQSAGEDAVTTAFDDYRTTAGIRLPCVISQRSNNGTWSAHVRAVEPLGSVTPQTFSPPPAPRDADLAAPTHVALAADHTLAVRVNEGAPLRFLLDTGGQNVITPEAAARLGLGVTGEGRVGGAGASVEPVRYTRVRSLRVGAAVLRDQPFLVLSLGAGVPFDGIIGYELFARFAARLDLTGGTLDLAPNASAFGDGGVAVPMTFADRQPQVAGAIDGIPATLTIDTGSAEAVDVNTPFVRTHDLNDKYAVTPRGMLYAGVGGEVDGWLARAKELRIGPVSVRDVRLALTDARAGVEIDPSIDANVGDAVLRRFTIVFDYRGGLLRFTPVPSP